MRVSFKLPSFTGIAAPTVLPIAFAAVLSAALAPTASAQNITGAGGSAVWTAQNNSTYGFYLSDASYSGQSDAFDNALVTSVNGVATLATTVGTVTSVAEGNALTATGITGGLNFTKTFTAFAGQPVLRTLLTFENSSNNGITFNLLLQNNVGSDSSTQVVTTSSGDTTFTTADNSIITDDSTTGGDPTNTHVLFGSEDGSLVPDAVGLTVFSASGTEGVSAQFSNFTLASGQTASFLFFNRLDTTASNAMSYFPNFGSGTSVQQAGLLAGLSNQQVASVRNFSFSANATAAPEPGSLALLLPILGTVGVVVRRRRK